MYYPAYKVCNILKKFIKNYIETRRELKTFYKKGIGVLLKITLGNIKKKELKLKESAKGNK